MTTAEKITEARRAAMLAHRFNWRAALDGIGDDDAALVARAMKFSGIAPGMRHPIIVEACLDHYAEHLFDEAGVA
jgi:hypothetical protein